MIGRSRFTVPHRPLATRFGLRLGCINFVFSVVGRVDAWLSRGPALQTLTTRSRCIGQAATLMYALFLT
jgi:hypothetical protein